jgi:hypothetical protein
MAKPLLSSPSVTSLCAAFPKPNGKSSPLLQLTQRLIHATTANSRPGFFLQTRPLSGDGIMGLFKNDAQKKSEKDQESTNNVYLPHEVCWECTAEEILVPHNKTTVTPPWLFWH